jgi:hypothetical protein
MNDVVVTSHVEAPAGATLLPHQKEYVAGRAVIGYDSILDESDVSITATSETDGFSPASVKSRLTFSGWRPSVAGANYLTFTGSRGHKVNYLCIAGHNLASKGVTGDLEAYDGSAWYSVLDGFVATSDAPLMLVFGDEERLAYRLKLNVVDVAYPTIAAVLLGERLDLQRGIYVGHAPAPYSPDVDFLTEESEGGQVIGSVALGTQYDTGVSLKHITPAWFRSHFAPFLTVARRKVPFCFMWNTDDRYKGEVIYGTLTNRPAFSNDHKSFMSGELGIRGLA